MSYAADIRAVYERLFGSIDDTIAAVLNSAIAPATAQRLSRKGVGQSQGPGTTRQTDGGAGSEGCAAQEEARYRLNLVGVGCVYVNAPREHETGFWLNPTCNEYRQPVEHARSLLRAPDAMVGWRPFREEV